MKAICLIYKQQYVILQQTTMTDGAITLILNILKWISKHLKGSNLLLKFEKNKRIYNVPKYSLENKTFLDFNEFHLRIL